MLRLAILVVLAFQLAGPAAACDNLPHGSQEWWECKRQSGK